MISTTAGMCCCSQTDTYQHLISIKLANMEY